MIEHFNHEKTSILKTLKLKLGKWSEYSIIARLIIKGFFDFLEKASDFRRKSYNNRSYISLFLARKGLNQIFFLWKTQLFLKFLSQEKKGRFLFSNFKEHF
jgi:hypothetical protein